MAPLAGSEISKDLGHWRDKVVFTKKNLNQQHGTHLMLGNCLSSSSNQSVSLLRLFWCMKDSTRAIETARIPTKNESSTLSFNIFHNCLRWQTKAIWKEEKKKRVCSYPPTMLPTFVYHHLLRILFLKSIILQEALTKTQPTPKLTGTPRLARLAFIYKKFILRMITALLSPFQIRCANCCL